MNVRIPALTATLFVVLATWSSTVTAQGYMPPAGPTANRYQGLYNAPTDPLGSPYHQYVVPENRLRNNLNQLNAATASQEQRLGQVEQDLLQQPSGIGPTGKRSTFQNLSHFYGQQSPEQLATQRRANRVGHGRVGADVGLRRGGHGGVGTVGRTAALGAAMR